MELSHTKGILRMNAGLYLVDTWDTKRLCCFSAVLDRCFARSEQIHRWRGYIVVHTRPMAASSSASFSESGSLFSGIVGVVKCSGGCAPERDMIVLLVEKVVL
jgi:hypothetical protein